MYTITQPLAAQPDCSCFDYLNLFYTNDLSEYLFFDIETTGFSAKSCHCYLIGVVFYDSATCLWNYTQWFAANKTEEIEILSAFYNCTKNFSYLISFNGAGFDIPFLMERMNRTDALKGNHFEHMTHIDIFREIRPLKKLLQLENYKQKSIELFLGINREDLYHGGQLIEIYENYSKVPTEEALSLLLLHNHDDIIGMASLLPILNYRILLADEYFFNVSSDNTKNLIQYEESTYQDEQGTKRKELFFCLKSPLTFPVRVLRTNLPFACKLEGTTITLRVPIFEDTLKYFYPNPKDYYYIPEEDTAMHKSVAAYIDKNHRKQATAKNCYVKKTGQYLPQLSEDITPVFCTGYKELPVYFAYTDSFLNDTKKMLQYIIQTLQQIIK